MREGATDDVNLELCVTEIAGGKVKDELVAVVTRSTSAIKNGVLTWLSLEEALRTDTKALFDAAVLATPVDESSKTMNTPNNSSPVPSAKALEVAAMVRLAAMVKDGDKKPSLEALQITARMMAEKTHRELLAREQQLSGKAE